MTHKQNYLYNLLDDRQWSLPGDDTFLAGTHTRYRMLFHWRNTQAPRMMDNYPRKCTARPWDQTPCILQSTCRKHWCTGQDLLTNDTHNNSKCQILAKSNVSSLIYLFIYLFIYLSRHLIPNSSLLIGIFEWSTRNIGGALNESVLWAFFRQSFAVVSRDLWDRN